MNLKMLNKSRGITIIELLVVVAVISTLGVLSTAFYARFLTQNAVDNVDNQLVASFRKAQVYSMMGKQNGVWGVKYDSAAKKITLYLSGSGAFDESFSVNSNINIEFSDGSDFTNITFAKITGLPPSGSYPLTITISGGNNSKIITVNSQGVVSKQ